MDYIHKYKFHFESEDEDDREKAIDSEDVMKEIRTLYNTNEVGLLDASKSLFSSQITIPHQKTTVLLLGSHNAAKKKFLDLYFNESRQNDFVPMSTVSYEKFDKIFITQGMKRRFLSGETVLDYCPHLAKLGKVPGLKNYLTTEITARKTKSLVSFVLAPENMDMIDNEVNGDAINNNGTYPRRIGSAIQTLAEAADLIFIFFDPTGSTSPSKTLKILEDVWDRNHAKTHLLLAKASELECSEETRKSTFTNVVEHVWENPQIQKFGYIPQIFCPDLTDKVRREEQLWNTIQETTDKCVEKALNQLERDATLIEKHLSRQLEMNNDTKKWSIIPSTLGILMSVCFIICFLKLMNIFSKTQWLPMSKKFETLWKEITGNRELQFFFITVLLSILFLLIDDLYTPMLEEEEQLYNRRARFASHAIYRKESMQKLISKSIESESYPDIHSIPQHSPTKRSSRFLT